MSQTAKQSGLTARFRRVAMISAPVLIERPFANVVEAALNDPVATHPFGNGECGEASVIDFEQIK